MADIVGKTYQMIIEEDDMEGYKVGDVYVVRVDKLEHGEVFFTCIIDTAGDLVGRNDLSLDVDRFSRGYKAYPMAMENE